LNIEQYVEAIASEVLAAVNGPASSISLCGLDAREAHPREEAAVSILEPDVSREQWKAAALNRLFREQGMARGLGALPRIPLGKENAFQVRPRQTRMECGAIEMTGRGAVLASSRFLWERTAGAHRCGLEWQCTTHRT
jgi:hypothetical protein